jgi:AraC-like DNA-binding protein
MRVVTSEHPIVCFEVPVHRGGSPPGHTHAFHEVFFCRKHEGIQYAEDREYVAREGDLFLLPRNQPHCAQSGGDVLDAIVLYVGDVFPSTGAMDETCAKVWTQLCNRADAGENRIELFPSGRRALREGLDEMLAEARRYQTGQHWAMRILFERVLLGIYRDPCQAERFGAESRPSVNRRRVEDVLRYVHTHYQQTITVAQMSRLACLSRSHFHAVFKQETGMTLTDYIHSVRLRHAVELLEQKIDVAEVALRVGFENLSHFYHLFKRAYGMAPKQYCTETCCLE